MNQCNSIRMFRWHILPNAEPTTSWKLFDLGETRTYASVLHAPCQMRCGAEANRFWRISIRWLKLRNQMSTITVDFSQLKCQNKNFPWINQHPLARIGRYEELKKFILQLHTLIFPWFFSPFSTLKVKIIYSSIYVTRIYSISYKFPK